MIQVSTGTGHSMVLLEDGTLMTYGEGHQACLGRGNMHDRYIDDKVPLTTVVALQGAVVAQISAGACCSVVLLRGGQVLTFGYGASGCLGHADARGRWLPTVVDALQGDMALQISAGISHFTQHGAAAGHTGADLAAGCGLTRALHGTPNHRRARRAERAQRQPDFPNSCPSNAWRAGMRERAHTPPPHDPLTTPPPPPLPVTLRHGQWF